jgi:hypothetical protein
VYSWLSILVVDFEIVSSSIVIHELGAGDALSSLAEDITLISDFEP